MTRCYSVPVKNRHPSLPRIWLISDARNDALLEAALARLPRGCGLIFRHYHLPSAARRARFDALRRAAIRYGHTVVLAGEPTQARAWRADGAYGPPAKLSRGPVTLRLCTVHSLRELAQANRARADAVLVSPVFPTTSHPGGRSLGTASFGLLCARAQVPVIALGGMTAARARPLRAWGWAAIDGLS